MTISWPPSRPVKVMLFYLDSSAGGEIRGRAKKVPATRQEGGRVHQQFLELLQETAGLRAVGHAMVNRQRGFHEEGDPDLAGRRKWNKPGFPILTPHKEPSGMRRHLRL